MFLVHTILFVLLWVFKIMTTAKKKLAFFQILEQNAANWTSFSADWSVKITPFTLFPRQERPRVASVNNESTLP